MIETKSVDGAKILARQLKGELREFIDTTRDKLISLLAHSEVMIDYAEEDIDDNILQNLEITLEGIEQKLEDIVKSSLQRKGVIEGFWLAIVGKPNVGKSSVLNKMLRYDRAIVSDIAGTTRDTIEEQVRIGSHIVRVADTAGIRDASDQIEKLGIKRSIKWLDSSDIIVAIFDASQPLDEQDIKVLELIKNSRNNKKIVVLNKIDKALVVDKKLFEEFETIEISAKSSVDLLIDKIETILNSISKSDELMLISSRQIESTKKALKEIQDAKEPLSRVELEFFSYHINSAIEALNEITKPYNHEELMDKMFSEFCLGK